MILLILLILLILFLLGGSFYAYRIAFYNPPSDPDKAPNMDGSVYETYREEIIRLYRQIRDRECEAVTILSDDGLKLYGRYYHQQDGAPLDICFHGYRSRSFTDFAGGSELSFELGHNLLLVDQRSHGRSEGRTITFGIRERWDVLNWTEYAVNRFGKDTKIFLYGVSMGAATVLMASGLKLPENVRGIVADCPYSRPMDIILHVGQKNPLPQWLIRPFVILGARIWGGFDVWETDAAEAVSNASVPILIVHGEADTLVPSVMSELSHSTDPHRIHRETFPGAEHALSFLSDPKRYRAMVRRFISECLN